MRAATLLGLTPSLSETSTPRSRLTALLSSTEGIAMALERAQFGQTPVRRRFPGRGLSPSAVRRFLDDVLVDWGLAVGPTRDTVLLLGSELASNAVEHTSTGFTVSIRVAGMQARIDVYDTGAVLSTLLQPAAEADRGRGLLIVDRLSSAWGASPAPGGKDVWFEVPLAS